MDSCTTLSLRLALAADATQYTQMRPGTTIFEPECIIQLPRDDLFVSAPCCNPASINRITNTHRRPTNSIPLQYYLSPQVELRLGDGCMDKADLKVRTGVAGWVESSTLPHSPADNSPALPACTRFRSRNEACQRSRDIIMSMYHPANDA